jgi:hypothetical protein
MVNRYRVVAVSRAMLSAGAESVATGGAGAVVAALSAAGACSAFGAQAASAARTRTIASFDIRTP